MPEDRTLHSVAKWKELTIPVLVLVGKISNTDRLRRFHSLQRQYGLLSDAGKDNLFVLARGSELVKDLWRLEAGGITNPEDLLSTLEEKHPVLCSITESLLQAMKLKKQDDLKRAYLRLDQALSRLILKANMGFGDTSEVGLTRDGWRLMVISILNRLDTENQLDVREWVKQVKPAINECILLAGGKKSGPKLRLLDSFDNTLKKRSLYPMNIALASTALPDEVKKNIRTIHTAKGLERDAVLIVASTPQQFSRWVKIEDNMSTRDVESRIGFVAFSRAKKLLCIATDSLTPERRAWLNALSFVKIIDLIQPEENVSSKTMRTDNHYEPKMLF